MKDRLSKQARWDRLSPEARRKAERGSERKTFGDATALSEALQRAKALQDAPPTADNPARTQRLKWRQTPPNGVSNSPDSKL